MFLRVWLHCVWLHCIWSISSCLCLSDVFVIGRLSLITVGLLSLSVAENALANDDKQLVFRENQQFAPYLHRTISAKSGTPGNPQGFIPALLKFFMDDHGVEVKYLQIPRNRVVPSYAKQELDASILSPEWIDNPDDFVFSQPLGSYRTVLFTSDVTINELISIESVKSQYICARRGYRYPNFQHLWKKNNLIRVDFSDEHVQLQGLIAERCQYAILDEAVARWYISKHFRDQKISIAAIESEIPLTIGFRKGKADMAEKFNKTISRLKANGELGILQRVFKVNTLSVESAAGKSPR
ncbi:MAG: transporter substrate-binding domain-containing protein [Pseudomonadales bacterium]|nr:transporter substrate-binding domain-containing protein [Pseudomonadales bacterium]